MLTRYKDRFQAAAELPARILLRLGFSPNGSTLLSLGLSVGASGFLLVTGDAVLFGLLMIAAGLLDAVDGAAARLTGRATKFGSYLDAVCDRFSEAAGCFAVAYVSGEWTLIFIGFVGAYSVSYAKARAAMEIAIDNNQWPDLLERTERGLIFAILVIVWGLFPDVRLSGHSLLFWGLLPLVTLVYLTLLQRLLRARRLLLRVPPSQ